ncbi:MAG: hypothetical protein N2053_02965 [Chitinispirillaceae bacterium]|nr:hypothetical protein [Chitinispirillaceae bacterium]
MKKNIIFFTLVLILICGGLIYFYKKQTTNKPSIEKARQYELNRKFEESLALYSQLLVEKIPTFILPDVRKSILVSFDFLKEEFHNFFKGISIPSENINPEVSECIDGILRCEKELSGKEFDNKLGALKIKKLSLNEYIREWNKIFIPPHTQLDSSYFIAMGTEMYTKKFSIIRLSSAKSYNYEIFAINKDIKKCMKGILVPESSVDLFILPGEHFLLCRSSVAFTTRNVWMSEYTPLKINVPAEPSLITANLITQISRKKR